MAKKQTQRSSTSEAKRTNRPYLIFGIGGILCAILLAYNYGYGVDLGSFKTGLNAVVEQVTKKDDAVLANAPAEESAKWTWKNGPRSGAKLLSSDDIRYVDGGKPLLVIIGHVFDVTKGFKMYAPGSGYHGFIGKWHQTKLSFLIFYAEILHSSVDYLPF